MSSRCCGTEGSSKVSCMCCRVATRSAVSCSSRGRSRNSKTSPDRAHRVKRGYPRMRSTGSRKANESRLVRLTVISGTDCQQSTARSATPHAATGDPVRGEMEAPLWTPAGFTPRRARGAERPSSLVGARSSVASLTSRPRCRECRNVRTRRRDTRRGRDTRHKRRGPVRSAHREEGRNRRASVLRTQRVGLPTRPVDDVGALEHVDACS